MERGGALAAGTVERAAMIKARLRALDSLILGLWVTGVISHYCYGILFSSPQQRRHCTELTDQYSGEQSGRAIQNSGFADLRTFRVRLGSLTFVEAGCKLIGINPVPLQSLSRSSPDRRSRDQPFRPARSRFLVDTDMKFGF